MTYDAGCDALILRTFLESIHPGGSTTRVHSIGGEAAAATSDGAADVVLLKPTREQCRDDEWIKAAVSDAVQKIAPEGLIYVLAARRYRATIRGLLNAKGLAVGAPVIHLASGAARYFVPLSPGPLGHAQQTWPLSRRWRHVHRLLGALPGASNLLATALPTVGFPAVRRGSQAFQWLLSHLPSGAGQVTLATSWRGPQGSVLLFAFNPDAAQPSLVIKRCPSSKTTTCRQEALQLDELGPAARKTGMRVPELVEDDVAGNGWLVQTALPGQPASRLLAGRPSEFTRFVDEITAWLARWNSATLQTVELTHERYEQELLVPAKKLGNSIEGAKDYIRWLTAAADKLVGQRVPLVSVHGDLTMANVLRGADGRMGLVDWEAARPLALPLTDFWYAACDAAAAVDEYRDRPKAFQACFGKNGMHRKLLQSGEQTLRSVVNGPAGWIDICFHACWLQHAANEYLHADFDRPFLSIANSLSRPDSRASSFA